MNIIITGDNGPRQTPPTPKELQAHYQRERAIALKRWTDAGHDPKAFGFVVVEPTTSGSTEST